MKQKYYLIFGISILLILISGCAQQTEQIQEKSSQQKELPQTEIIKGLIIIKQVGGTAIMSSECADKDYITKTADFIVGGTIENVDTKWNDEKTKIFTYSDLIIKDYLKGQKIENDKLQIITSGGCVGEICESVEDQPILHEGKNVVIYFKEIDGEFSIVCGNSGVEEIKMEIIS